MLNKLLPFIGISLDIHSIYKSFWWHWLFIVWQIDEEGDINYLCISIQKQSFGEETLFTIYNYDP